jgi:hypothetical protein
MDTGDADSAAGGTPVAELRITGSLRAVGAVAALRVRWPNRTAAHAHRRPERLPAHRRRDIELLLELHRMLHRDGDRLLIREPAAPVRRLLRIARVDQVLTITSDGDGTDSRPPVLQHGEALA